MVTRRKKDHGRAEAMLIAAWGLGMRVAADTSAPPGCGSTCPWPVQLFGV